VRCYRSMYVLSEYLRSMTHSGSVFFIADRGLLGSYQEIIIPEDDADRSVLTIDGSEANKTLKTVEDVASELALRGLTRGGNIVAIGGGVVTDVAGFVASIYMRGVPV